MHPRSLCALGTVAVKFLDMMMTVTLMLMMFAGGCRFNSSAASSARSIPARVDAADAGAQSSRGHHVTSHCTRHCTCRRLPLLTRSLSPACRS